MSQYAHLSTPDPEFAAMLSKLPAVPPPKDIYALRESSAAARKTRPKVFVPEGQLKVEDWKIPVQGGEIAVRTYVPHGEGHSYPLLVWAHGGGFSMGGLDNEEAMLKNLAIEMRLSAVNVDYRLAPEFPFPTGLNDTFEALKWASAHALDLQADLEKGFLIGGTSSGANFMAVLSHRARDDPVLRRKITGQILQIPALVHWEAFPERYKGELVSPEQNKDAPILSRARVDLFNDAYHVADPADPDASPLLFASHKDLPPAYLQVCGLDPLRDEGLLYEKVLKEEGVKTKLDVYPGLPHGFHAYLPGLEKGEKWKRDLREGITWLLAGGA